MSTLGQPQASHPVSYIGAIELRRVASFCSRTWSPDPTRVVLHFEMPLAELIVDYFDQLKSRSQGYASMDYEELGYRPANLAKVDILVNGEPVDALSLIVHRDKAQLVGRVLAERLKQLIPRQMFEIPIQAAIGSNVIAEASRPWRKNVWPSVTWASPSIAAAREHKRQAADEGSAPSRSPGGFLAMLVGRGLGGEDSSYLARPRAG